MFDLFSLALVVLLLALGCLIVVPVLSYALINTKYRKQAIRVTFFSATVGTCTYLAPALPMWLMGANHVFEFDFIATTFGAGFGLSALVGLAVLFASRIHA